MLANFRFIWLQHRNGKFYGFLVTALRMKGTKMNVCLSKLVFDNILKCRWLQLYVDVVIKLYAS